MPLIQDVSSKGGEGDGNLCGEGGGEGEEINRTSTSEGYTQIDY